jgi:hypothetical protein
MAAFDPATLDRWRALAIVDRDGTTVGTVSEFYLDRETGHPTWALVDTGLFGATQTFVPLVHAAEIDDGLQVPYEKSHIKDAPHIDPHDELTPDEEATLFSHYGVEYRPSTGPEPGVASSPEADPGAPGPDEWTDAVPAEPGTIEPAGPPGAEAGQAEPAPERSDEEPPRPDPDLSRPAPVEPGLPGSIPATPSGPTPTTIDVGDASEPRDVEREDGPPPPDTEVDRWPSATPERAAGDPDLGSDGPGPVPATDEAANTAGVAPDSTREAPAADQEVHPGRPAGPAALLGEDGPGAPSEAGWAPGAFGERELADRPAGASDRWREAKLAAERDRIARAAAAQPEERSPLERARRRLERLVSGGQASADTAETSLDDRDAAERARRERLGIDEDDPRSR